MSTTTQPPGAASVREQMIDVAASMGLSTTTIAAVVHATLPEHQTGEPVTDQQAAAVIEALHVLYASGAGEDDITALVEHYETQWGDDDWRERLWTLRLRIANHRESRTPPQPPAAAAPLPAVDQQPMDAIARQWLDAPGVRSGHLIAA